MTSEISRALWRASAATFEHLAFLLPDPEPSEGQLESGPEQGAAVTFRGPLQGRVELRMAGAVVDELAAAMLGATPPVDPADRDDALGEAVNVICGNVLPDLAGPDAVFDLDAPGPLAGAAAGGGSSTTIAMGLGDGLATVRLVVEENRGDGPA